MRRKVSGKKGIFTVGYKIKENGCWIWQGCTDSVGYGQTCRGRKYRKAHQFYYAQKYGDVPVGKELHHKCETPLCVNPDHLQPLTHKENCQITQGKIGDFLKEIMQSYRQGKSIASLARKFNVTKDCINNFVKGRTWTNIKLEDENGQRREGSLQGIK